MNKALHWYLWLAGLGGDAYRALLDHIQASGMRVTGPPREWYLTDPASTPDPSHNVTRVEFPVG